jgi:hypothetical protein
VALGQVCVGESGTGKGLRWTEWDWDKFAVDRVALIKIFGGHSSLTQVCVGESGTGTGLTWTEWDWDSFVLD